MTRSGDDYIRGLRDGRVVLLNGERVGDVTSHPAFAGGIRTVARLYDLAHDSGNRELMTYPSPRDGRPINKTWLVPRTRDDLVARRRAIKFWAEASYGFLGRSPDHVGHRRTLRQSRDVLQQVIGQRHSGRSGAGSQGPVDILWHVADLDGVAHRESVHPMHVSHT